MENENKIFLGIDWGKAKIGLAIANSENNLALPLKRVKNLSEVLKVIEEENINEIVLGKPLKMSGRSEFLSDFSTFLKVLKVKVEIPVNLIDERLTSKMSDKLPGNKKTKVDQDVIAAMIILQNFLDKNYGNNT